MTGGYIRRAVPTEQSPAAEELARALTEAVAILESQGEPGLRAFLDSKPVLAPEIARRLALLRDSGMLEGEEATALVPERLGEFVLGERLGGGGMGVVYAASQPSLGRQVALKLIRPEHLYFPGARERFRREIEAIARLEHPGIVRVYCAGEDGGVPYFAMERVAGLSLDRLLGMLRDRAPAELDERAVRQLVAPTGGEASVVEMRGRGRRWSELCCRWLCDLALAIDHAHRHGVLHRDLKPSNVIVTPDLSVKLLDFGLASTREGSHLTRTGSQVGSLPYMAPEQVEGRGADIDERTDVYALGVTMYELLTLHSPFLHDGESEEQTRRRILEGAAPPVRARNPSVPWDAETVCAVAMDPVPQRRYASAADFARDLHNVLELRSIAARRPGPARRLARLARRRPAWAVGILLGSLIVLVGPTLWAIREKIVGAQISKANQEARIELQTKDGILRFLNDDLLAAVAPDEAGRHVPMREVLDRAAVRIEGRFTDLPHVEAAIRETIGHTYTLLGAHEQAEPHLLRAAALFAEHRGPSHPLTLQSRRQLAHLYSEQDRLPEAAALGAEVVRATEAALGPEHADTLTAKNNLGLVLLRMGRFDEAEQLLRAVVDLRRRLLGDEDRTTLASIANLGLLYYNSGRPILAEPWWRLDLEGSRRVFGADHPDLLVTLNNWASLQTLLGNLEDSRTLHEELVERAERVHGAEHSFTIDRLRDLGIVLGRLGENARARHLVEDALVRCRGLAPDHRSVLGVREALAHVQASAGDLPAALATIDQALADLHASTTPQPVGIQRFELMQVGILLKLKRWEEAAAQGARTASAIEAAGISNTHLAEAKTYLGVSLLELGRTGDAERALLEAEAGWRAHSPRDSDVALTHRSLIRLYETSGQAEKAATWRETARQWQADAARDKQD
jgi:serine/threonine protein kinase/tetratricopeptide (TPR) repeat protein